MNQTVLGENQYLLEEQIRNRIIFCIAALIAAIVCNIVLTLFRTPQNHTIFMVLNMALDMAAGWFCIWQLDSFILPYKKLLKLYRKTGTTVSGTVEEISSQTQRYYGFDCFAVTVDGHKLFVVDNGTISLEPMQPVTLEVVHGIVKEVVL